MPIHDFKSQRLYLDHPLGEGTAIELDRSQANYLISVLRLKSGAQLLVFNGRDGEWRAQFEVTGRKSGTLTPFEQTRLQPPANDLVYCFAPLRQARQDYMIQKAVEMGAGVLQPVITQHTQVHKVNLQRMQANAIEAAEQCGILCIPDCREALPLETLLEQWNGKRILIFADEASAEINPLEVLKACRGSPLGLLVGPEGGFSQAEREQLASFENAVTISLGPRILRADTAGVAALAVTQAACGDW